MPSLAEQLAAQKQGFLKNAPPQIAEVMGQVMARLKASDVLGQALTPGEKAPLFQLPDATGQVVSLQERLSRGPAVLCFYRGVW